MRGGQAGFYYRPAIAEITDTIRQITEDGALGRKRRDKLAGLCVGEFRSVKAMPGVSGTDLARRRKQHVANEDQSGNARQSVPLIAVSSNPAAKCYWFLGTDCPD